MSDIFELKGKIKGDVQGVGFRYFIYDTAIKLGLKGYVKNAEENSVEFAAQGDQESLLKFQKIIKIGPSLARIDNCEFKMAKADRLFNEFKIAID